MTLFTPLHPSSPLLTPSLPLLTPSSPLTSLHLSSLLLTPLHPYSPLLTPSHPSSPLTPIHQNIITNTPSTIFLQIAIRHDHPQIMIYTPSPLILQVCIYRIEGFGWGVKAVQNIKKGRYVISYLGEVCYAEVVICILYSSYQ